MKKQGKIQIITVVLLVLFLSACFNVRVMENVENPDRYFKKAYRQIEQIHRRYPDREGTAHSIHILVYEGSERKLIKVSSPLWVVNSCMDLGMELAENDSEVDFEERYDFDWRDFKDLRQFGPGLLVEVDDEEDKILIWLQ